MKIFSEIHLPTYLMGLTVIGDSLKYAKLPRLRWLSLPTLPFSHYLYLAKNIIEYPITITQDSIKVLNIDNETVLNNYSITSLFNSKGLD